MTEILEFIHSHPLISLSFWLSVLAVGALFANFVVKTLLLRVLRHVMQRTPAGRDPELRVYDVIERLANIMPALVIEAGIDLVPHVPPALAAIVKNVSNAFIILMAALAIGRVCSIADKLYHRRPVGQRRPIKGYIQLVEVTVYIVATLLIVAVLFDRSPLVLLSGLGAMAAVLILVFQDTLLSLVAGIQISSTDMVRVGDWIEMPSQNADGFVMEIALHTVKIQNWDKTITTVPIRKLVTEPYKNWRGMSEAGGRRIKRAIYIDQTSISFMTPEDHERLRSFGHLGTYLARKREEIEEWNSKLGERAQVPANTRRTTNIGTFRAYVENYLRNHPEIRQDMTLLVRQMPPGPEGLPLEIYCFTNSTAWAVYEGIQADIFDHLFAIMPEFGLRVFQSPSGWDAQSIKLIAT